MRESPGWIKILTLLLPALFLSQPAAAGSQGKSDTAVQIHALFEQAGTAAENEDLDALLKMLHPYSPVVKQTRQRLTRILKDRELHQEILGYHFLAEDLPYAIARAQVKWTGKGKKPFRSNITDSLYIFKKDGDQWKLWGQLPLDVMLLGGTD